MIVHPVLQQAAVSCLNCHMSGDLEVLPDRRDRSGEQKLDAYLCTSCKKIMVQRWSGQLERYQLELLACDSEEYLEVLDRREDEMVRTCVFADDDEPSSGVECELAAIV